MVIVVGLVLSAWTPVSASAKTSDEQIGSTSRLTGNEKHPKYITLTVDNRTGGAMYMNFNALPYRKDPTLTASYFLLAAKPGKNQYLILSGRYTYTLRSNNCGGKLTNTKVFNNSVILGPYYCDKR